MKFFKDFFIQNIKTGHTVCGDYCLCERTPVGTLYVLCDGIGSGVYANIAAIACAERIRELWLSGFSLRAAAETVASSMHRARTEDVPFSAFSTAHILPDGHFTVYSYEVSKPILVQAGGASVMSPRFYTVGYEVVGESLGQLDYGDALLLTSDGVTQAGMGHGYGFGIGEETVCKLINRSGLPPSEKLAKSIAMHCKQVSEKRFEDDTTIAFLYCREASEVNLFTGPPSKPSMDKDYAAVLQKSSGKKIVCGSTTMDIISRELDLPVETIMPRSGISSLPEYFIEGVDLAAEGAITLSQVCNVIDEPLDKLEDNTVVKQICVMLREADVINLNIGKAVNDAHENFMFKQIGVRVRRNVVDAIAQKLRFMGKLVTEKYY